jgi:hypothetical protein
MSTRRILRLDDDQAERCEGNLPFAVLLMAPLSMMGRWAGTAFAEGEIHFPAVAQTVDFGLGKSKMLCLSMGLTDTLSAIQII